MAIPADARPTKAFFISNLTRDLSLEDAILDLIDNSVDAWVRLNNLDVSAELLRRAAHGTAWKDEETPAIRVELSNDRFSIWDRCGGIPLDLAVTQVFRFGRTADAPTSTLSVYGIGLKRAVFKIGSHIEICSRTPQTGFRVVIDVEKWAENDDNWEFPVEEIDPARTPEEAGTEIVVTRLRDEVIQRLSEGTLLTRLSSLVGTTYSLFLQHSLAITINGNRVPPNPIPIGESEDVLPARRTLFIDGIEVEIFAGLAARKDGEWNIDRAGWYILCNGRVVVSADKTDLTGWGTAGPQFVSKYRGFVGVAFFFSTDPASLPWTTTKRGLNRESPAYQLVRRELALVARPVLSFLNQMYPSDPAESPAEREVADKVRQAELSKIAAQPQRTFAVSLPPRRRRGDTVSVQFKAKRTEVDKIRTKIGRPDWGAGAIGRYTFDYFLRVEVGE